MKKIIPIVLALALMATMSTTVFATESATEPGNSHEVLASYEEGVQDRTVISVDIGWNKMSFTYKGASEPKWDASSHQYVGEKTEAGWAASEATITIKNHSNTVLQALISYQSLSGYDGIRMHFTDPAPYVGSAYTDDAQDEEGNVCGQPCEITIKAILDGELDAETEDNTKIGAITITVNSNVDALVMLDTLAEQVSTLSTQDTSALSRGGVFLMEGTDINGLYLLCDAAAESYASSETTPAEKNVAINALLTALYGALDIVQ